MPEAVISYLRIRVVDRSPLYYFTDGFEQTGSGVTVNLWNSVGTDATGTLTYWTQVSGVWSIASNLVSSPAATGLMVGGTSDWQDMTWTVRFKFATSTAPMIVVHCDGTDSNWVGARCDGTNIFIDKVVGGVFTNGIVSSAAALVNGTFYWLKLQGAGTTYTATVYNDTGPGSIGSSIKSVNTTVSDAGLQSGQVGLRSTGTAVNTFGGAFTTVATATGTPPDGTQGQAWNPVVTAGEPAFAWSSKSFGQTGTYFASIYNANSAGNGSWQQAIRLFSGSNPTLSAQIRSGGGTANVSAGGLTTGNSPNTAVFAAVTATGAMTANPTVSCNYTGAVGAARFDVLSITNPAYEITNDLPHLHQTHIDRAAMQPGNPGSTAIGAFTVQLPPPGTEQYATNKAVYDRLDYVQRVEFYISHDAQSLGNLYYAGIITGIRKGYGQSPVFEISGVSDLFWLNYSKPFPAETLSLNYGSGSSINASYRQARNYFGTHELGASDTFNPFTIANYTSSNIPALTAGTWTGTTDDGLNVASCATGTGATLISKAGAAAGDKRHAQFVEISGRLKPSSDATNAGKFGVGLSASNVNCNTCTVVYVTAKANGSHWDLDVTATAYAAGSIAFGPFTTSSFLTTVDDPEGFIPITLSVASTNVSLFVAVNGKAATGLVNAETDFGTANAYPFLFFGTPATGSATTYETNLVQMVRYTDDQNAGTAAFASGTIGTPAHSLPPYITDPGPTFLEIITRAASRENWYWRYTPQAYIGGKRTLGTLDFTNDPGTNYGTNASVVFDRSIGNLVDLQLSANADQFMSATTAAGPAGTDMGGLSYWRDIASLTKYGVLEDQVLMVIAPNFSELRRGAINVSNNRVNLNGAGSKTAIVLRDAQTADKFREIDKVMIQDPEQNVSYLVARILGLSFDEGQGTQTLALDQFGVDTAVVLSRRFQVGVYGIAAKFGNR